MKPSTQPPSVFASTVSWIPLAAFAVLFSFAFVAWQVAGHWPVYSYPDPKALNLPLHQSAAFIAIPVGLLATLAGLVALIADSGRWKRWHIAVFILGAALWGMNAARVGGLLNWLLD